MPSKPRRVRRSRDAARGEIVAAAEDALVELDFSALTVDGVMRRTGMRRSSFYHHFSSLDELAVALLEQFEHELRASVEPWFEGEGDVAPPEATFRYLTAMFEVLQAHSTRVEAVAQAARSSTEVYDAWRSRVLDSFIEQTARTIRKRRTQPATAGADADRLAEALVLMNYALWNANLKRTAPDEPAALARVAAGVWNASIYGP